MTENPENDELISLIERWSRSDPTAQDALFKKLSPLMVRLARRQLNRHGGVLSLESRDLANEASLRLMKILKRPADEPHLVRLIAKITRAACVDLARERHAQKRAGHQVSLSLVDRQPEQPVDVLDLDKALLGLAKRDPVAAQVTELRFFAGLSEKETAQSLDVSRATVTRKWRMARLFLSRSLAR